MISHIPLFDERRRKPLSLLEIGLVGVRLYAIEPQYHPIRIRLLREVPIVQGDLISLCDTLGQILGDGPPCHDVAVVMNSPQLYHQLISLPPMKRLDREKVLRREIEQTAKTGEQELISFWLAGQRKKDDMVQEKVVCSKIPRFLAEVVIGTLKEKDLNFVGFTSYTQMLCHLVADQKAYSSKSLAMLEINNREGSITLFEEGIWVMERRFLLGTGTGRSPLLAPTGDSGLDQDKLLLEMDRALRFFNRQSRYQTIDGILLYGATSHLDDVKKTLENATKLPVTPLFLDTKKFGLISEGGTTVAGDAALVNIPSVVAMHSRFDKYIDFIPPEIRDRRRTVVKRYTVAAMVMAFYGILALIWLMVHREARKLDPQLANTETTSTVSNNPDERGNILGLRVFALAALQTEDWLQEKHRLPSELIRELAEIIPTEMKVNSIQFQQISRAWQVKLTAEIRASNGSLSQESLFRFQTRSHSTQQLSHLTLEQVELTDVEPAEALSRGATGIGGNLLTFSMSGTVPYSTPRI